MLSAKLLCSRVSSPWFAEKVKINRGQMGALLQRVGYALILIPALILTVALAAELRSGGG